MVMRNRHDGGGTPQGWDDLPPHVRNRFSRPLDDGLDAEPGQRPAFPTHAPQPQPMPSRGQILIDLSRLAVVILFVAAGILLYLLIALTYVKG